MSDALFSKAERTFFDRFYALNPHMATFVGLHDPYDRLMPDGSLAAIHEGVVVLKEFLETTESIDEDRLSPSRRIDKEVIRYAYDMARFRFEEHGVSHRNPEGLSEFLSVCFLMLVKNYAPLTQRLEAIAARLWELPVYLEDFRSRFQGGRTVQLWTQMAIEIGASVEAFVEHVAQIAVKEDPRLGSVFENASSKARTAIQAHRQWLESLQQKTTSDWSLGREKFEHLISIRDLGMRIPEILELGYQELQRTQNRQREIAREFGPDISLEKAYEQVMSDTPENFNWILNYISELIIKAKEFIKDNDLATVPGGGEILFVETPAFLRPFVSFAAIFPPGKFEKKKTGVCVMTRHDDRELVKRYFNRAELANMVLHETYPGHFLQAVVSHFSSETHLLSGALETIEGWAHYAEQLMMDRGFPAGPEARLAHARAMTWRAARLIVDVKMSCREMTFEEGVRFFMNEGGLDRQSAVSETRRCTLHPGHGLSYLVGKHLITRLKSQRRAALGPKFSEKAFHDTICTNGYLPIRLLEKSFETTDPNQDS